MGFEIGNGGLNFTGNGLEVSDAFDSSFNSAKDSIKESLGELLGTSFSESLRACDNANECE